MEPQAPGPGTDRPLEGVPLLAAPLALDPRLTPDLADGSGDPSSVHAPPIATPPAPGWRTTLTELGRLLLPPLCLRCRARPPAQPTLALCGHCWREFPRVLTPCRRCRWLDPDPELVPCEACRGGLPPLPLVAAGWYRGPLAEGLLAAKWGGSTGWVELLADLMNRAARREKWLARWDAWSPVPRDPRRRWTIGVPLSERLGAALGARLGIPRIAPPRRRWGRPQHGMDGEQRRRNIRDAFRPVRGGRFAGRRILIIDDVTTTGSTLAELAATLARAQALACGALVAAVAPARAGVCIAASPRAGRAGH